MGSVLKIFKRKKVNIEDKLKKIKDGDVLERENFINEYIPFIIKSITKVTNKYIEIENNDEFSIGLEAFNEAIDKYDFQKGSFIKYAETVIKSRTIDFLRKTKELNKVVSIDRDNSINRKVKGTSDNKDFTEQYEMKEQILKFGILLEKFDITFKELIEESPKHIDTRLNSIYIARSIIENEDIKKELYRKKTLPAKKIIEKIGVSKKVLKGNRKFIIATVLLLSSDLDLLIEYISGVEGRDNYGI
ncbi:RNA polymerase sigma-I factor [Abyssisolibacter fermentans]|uniref:RNA polymerase sigma-I factor n=1 Tax=Abyssisolibacter fermentans TaxID=1766203 RepID=UPI000835FAB6|nr:RNA polymerase sigma-I factor [Abyssisolibacter fermentans]